MSVTLLTGLGEVVTNFLLNDFSVYVMNTSATGNYSGDDWALLGYTSAEKTINPINEKYVREDKIPRVPTYTKTIRVGLEVGCDLSNQNPDIEALIKQGTKSAVTGTNTGTRIAYGTDQAPVEYRAVRFVAKLDDGKNYSLTIPKCEISQSGEKTGGGETETVTPLMFKAYYNAQAGISATANLYYENYFNSGVSPTAEVPSGYN